MSNSIKDPKNKPRLARFRADPERVRVAVRRCGSEWMASVSTRNGGQGAIEYVAFGVLAEVAVMAALGMADDYSLDGVDFDMNWTYDHPWAQGN